LGAPFQSKSQKAISYQLISLSAIRDDRQMAMKKFTLDLEKVLPGNSLHCYYKFTPLRREGKIDERQIRRLMSWRHSGFSVYRGNRIAPDDRKAQSVRHLD
jgi:hypothetical protein